MIYLNYFIYFIIIYAHWILTLPSSLTITLSIEDNTNDKAKKTDDGWDYEGLGRSNEEDVESGNENEGKDNGCSKQKGISNGQDLESVIWTQGEGLQSFKCKCGVSNNGGRIVGGKEVVPNEFPWQVGLFFLTYGSSNKPGCGGSLISSMTVLTAAHCTEGKEANSLLVVVGEHDISINDGEVCLPIKKIIIHPKYASHQPIDNDYSLLILKEPIKWNKKVSPVCLPTGDASFYENEEAIVTGWGKLKFGGKSSKTLQKVMVKTITNEQCTTGTAYKPSDITPNMICAAEASKDSCQGDSGGPLLINEKVGYYSQIGVVSWGFGCAMADAPGVYARVTSKLDWIKKNMKGDTCPAPGTAEKDVD